MRRKLIRYIAAKHAISRIRKQPLTLDGKKILPVIVSLTTIPSRLATLDITLKSILQEQEIPQKIILWVNSDLENMLPKTLLELVGQHFEIRYSSYDCSHLKLIHTIELGCDFPVITCDDDLIYQAGFVKNLYQAHLLFPDCVIANVCRIPTQQQPGQYSKYRRWPHPKTTGVRSSNLIPLGYGGVLYPQGSLSEQATDMAMAMKLAPKADDLWFKFMSLLNGTHVVHNPITTAKPLPIPGSQKISLRTQNVKKDVNREQWYKLLETYPHLEPCFI